MKALHQLQICPIVHNYRVPPTIPTAYIQVHAAVSECCEGQTDAQTAVTSIHFASATPHAKRNDHFVFCREYYVNTNDVDIMKYCIYFVM